MNIFGTFTRGARALAPACMIALAPLWGLAQGDGPPQEVFLPKSQKGPVVIVISGASGPLNYKHYGAQLAGIGYYAVLIDGKDILTRVQDDGAQNLRTVITKAQASPNAVPGKVAVVGFSQGGGGVLAAERDRFNNCCLIETIRELESAARAKQLPLELVVYPNAYHGFNLDGRTYRAADTDDAWRRTTEMLARHHPVK